MNQSAPLLLIGIDPGKHGAIVAGRTSKLGRMLVDVTFQPMPMIGDPKTKGSVVNFLGLLRDLRSLLSGCGDQVHVGIEHQQPMPLDSAFGGWAQARSFQAVLDAVDCATTGIPSRVHLLRAEHWQGRALAGLPRKTYKERKSSAVIAAQRLFPAALSHCERAEQSGVADALLIMDYLHGQLLSGGWIDKDSATKD